MPDPGRQPTPAEEAEPVTSGSRAGIGGPAAPGPAAPGPAAPGPADGDPADRLRAVFLRLGDDLRRAEADAVRSLDGLRGPDTGPAGVEIVEGRQAQGRRVLELELGARRTFDAFLTGLNTVTPVPDTLKSAGGRWEGDGPARHDDGPAAGYRILVDRDFLAEPEALPALEERVRAGEQVRVVDSPLMKLAVADGETAMVQVGPDLSLLLRPPLVVLAVELFAMAWRHSRPYLREGGDLSPADRRILQLMLSGLTDAATAKQVGTSPRTVQRRLRALMDAASVTSRLQLGWYAMRNNWV
ncbi:helix-turn-helix transcriptional regulator [Streptomyces sp. NBC_01335]|uniref:helix-turn-helix transcriptional regulator n=1 Tax=Streptomyces sp. NBC_01335 TaxID=2903828 RepID=UPI002E0FADD9|nr:helix-turn-helix transcriptional regulator [Streptomyces sp. NBC_01335]